MSSSSGLERPPCQICGEWHQPLPIPFCAGCIITYYRQCHTPCMSNESKFSWLCSCCKKLSRFSLISDREQLPTLVSPSISQSLSVYVSLPRSRAVRCTSCRKIILNWSVGSKWCKTCKSRAKAETESLSLQRVPTGRVSKPLFPRPHHRKVRIERVTLNIESRFMREFPSDFDRSLPSESSQTTQSRKSERVVPILETTSTSTTAPSEAGSSSLLKEQGAKNGNSSDGHNINQLQNVDDGSIEMNVKIPGQNFVTNSYGSEESMGQTLSLVPGDDIRLSDETLWGTIDPRKDWPPWPDMDPEEDLDAMLASRRAHNRELSRARFPVGGSYGI